MKTAMCFFLSSSKVFNSVFNCLITRLEQQFSAIIVSKGIFRVSEISLICSRVSLIICSLDCFSTSRSWNRICHYDVNIFIISKVILDWNTCIFRCVDGKFSFFFKPNFAIYCRLKIENIFIIKSFSFDFNLHKKSLVKQLDSS